MLAFACDDGAGARIEGKAKTVNEVAWEVAQHWWRLGMKWGQRKGGGQRDARSRRTG